MQARSTLILAAVVVAVVVGAVFIIQLYPAGGDRPAHGEFSRRFEPALPAPSVAQLDRQRQAGIGSIKELRPVEINRQ